MTSNSARSCGPVMAATLSAILGCLAAAPVGRAADVGTSITAFSLPDMHGRERSWQELADQPLIVVAFLGTECPLAKLYAPRLQELSDEYRSRGVSFIGIDANQQDSLTEMVTFAQQHGVTFPLLKDRDQKVLDQFGVERNPAVVVLDAQRKIRYRGRIDDQYGLGSSSGYARAEVKSRDLGRALEELLAGKEVSQPTTQALGCLIGRKPKAAPHGDITYTKHVAPLLESRCVSCHRPGEIGPFALTEYDEVVGWADMIREVVSQGRMPPWSANPEFGHFSNDARLSDVEKQTLYSWMDNGCPQGDPADLAPQRHWTDGWQISAPDQVVKMPKAFKVPAEGVVAYQHFAMDPGWKEDKWIQAAEVRPGNRAVVHHIIVFVLPPGALSGGLFGGGLGRGLRRGGEAGAEQREPPEIARGGGLTAYVPGSAPTVHRPGIATFVPKGSKIIFQMHYTPNGTEQLDQSYLGVVFADPTTVKKRVHGGAVMNRRLSIPPHADNYEVSSRRKLNEDQLLMSMSPHMHLRGKAFRYEAQYPDGHSEILLDVPQYDFNWQIRYELAEPKRLPAGTTLSCTAHYDNSDQNIANPDPDDNVHWGPQTWHEMMIGFYTTIPVADDAHTTSAATAPPPAEEDGEEDADH